MWLSVFCPEGRYSSALPKSQLTDASIQWSFSAPKGVIAVRYEYVVTAQNEREAFQCPEGRYSSALRGHGWDRLYAAMFQCPEGRYSSALHPDLPDHYQIIGGFSAPKGVIAVRYRTARSLTLRDGVFQCPEGRYSSALPQDKPTRHPWWKVSVPRRAL